MGITGLLPFLKKIHTPVNISQFRGSTVAVDAYCWLHKGAFSCAEKLALGEKTDQYVYYCLKYIDNLQRQDLKVIMVFDGCHLESKAGVEKARRERRESSRKKAAQFLREGKRSEAKDCLQKCVDITPQMALDLMNACRARGVNCIVAPYEADAQLAHLSNTGIAQLIITEDSDLLVFGCEKIIFKMDFHGNGTLIEKSRLNEVMGVQTDFYTFDKFRYMCILSGCDYLPSISGIGLAKANKVFKTARQGDVKQVLKKLPTYLKMNVVVSSEYVEGFVKANNTFLHQLIFDPLTRSLKPLTSHPPELKGASLNYAGKFLSPDLAYQIALGNIDIHTNEVIGYFNPDNKNTKTGSVNARSRHLLSIWDRRYRPKAAGSPCKELQTSESVNRDNATRISSAGKDAVISTARLKRMLAKPNKEVQEPAMSSIEMIALYTNKEDEEIEIERAKKNLMISSDGFSALDMLVDDNDPVAQVDCVKENSDRNLGGNSEENKNNSGDDDNDDESKCSIAGGPFRYTPANIGEEAFKRDGDDIVKENEAVVKSNVQPHRRNIFAVSKSDGRKNAETSPAVDDSVKENKAVVKSNAHPHRRNIFAVSKSVGRKNTETSPAVEVRSWYFSSSSKTSSPVKRNSPKQESPVSSKGISSPLSKVKSKLLPCNPSSLRSLFERAGERNKTSGTLLNNQSRSEDNLSKKGSSEYPSDQNVKSDVDAKMASSKSSRWNAGKNEISDARRKGSTSSSSSLSKLSAFSWSRSHSVRKAKSIDKDERTSSSVSDSQDRRQSASSFFEKCKDSTADLENRTNFMTKRSCPLDSSDIPEEQPAKKSKTSSVVSNYFVQNENVTNSSSQDFESEQDGDVQEVQHQSYDGFLKSLGGDVSYTKLLDEPRLKTVPDPGHEHDLSNFVMKEHSGDGDVDHANSSSSKLESAEVIDLTEDPKATVKSMCRVSGLSKSKGKKRSLDKQQPKIQNFFSKFSFERKNTSQLSVTREPDATNVDDELDEDPLGMSSTPVSSKPHPDVGHVKRKLSI